MTRAELTAKYAGSAERRLLVSRLFDLSAAAEKTGRLAYGRFMTPPEYAFAQTVAVNGGLSAVFDGGFDGAERVCAMFLPEWGEKELKSREDYPLCALTIACLGEKSLSRRDFLGALLGLGLKREMLGDIIVGEGSAEAVVFHEIADFIVYNLEKVGSSRVRAGRSGLSSLSRAQESGRMIYGTVASVRLDAVARLAYNISREDAKELIASGGIMVNHTVVLDPDRRLSAGDLLSVRGYGRARLAEAGELTKKGRIKVGVLAVK